MDIEKARLATYWEIYFKDWSSKVDNLDEKLITPGREATKEFLKSCGADFENLVGHEDSLKKWTVKGMSSAMEAVWGSRWEDFKNWNDEFIAKYEKETGKTLPSIAVYKRIDGKRQEVGRSKQSGMKHVFCVLTRWAAFTEQEDPNYSRDLFLKDLVVRVDNGILRSKGGEYELGSVIRPDTGEVYHPSVPPGYISAMMDFLTSKE